MELLPQQTLTSEEKEIDDDQNTILLYQSVDDRIGRVCLVDHMGSDLKIINAARVSYGKEIEEFKDKDRKLIKYLIENAHTSPFEHAVMTFKFVVPMFVARQHQRHRTFSYWSINEISRRYTFENIKFYEPTRFRKQDDKDKQSSNEWFEPDMSFYSNQSAHALLEQHTDSAVSLYDALIQSGVGREMARMVLPFNLYTEYYGTCDLHNLFHFLDLRSSDHAQWEIRQVAMAIKEFVKRLFPVSYECRFGKRKRARSAGK